MRYFFYGTLLDADVRRHVLGAWADRRAAVPAALPGYRRVYLRARAYPVVVPDRDGAVAGLVVDGIDRHGAARLAGFESPEYLAAALRVVTADGKAVRATVFVASRLARTTRRDWDLETWQRLEKRAFARRHGFAVTG